MIDCKHKHCVVAMNVGYTLEKCNLFQMLVNDEICGNCDSCEGKMTQPPVEVDFLKRNDHELKAISMVCNQCPLFDLKSQMCKKYKGLPVPVSSWSQHPSNHCPEHQW